MKLQWTGRFAVIATVAGTVAIAAAGYKVKPGVYDPDDTGLVAAAWVAKDGLPDGGNSNHGLYLAKQAATSTNAAAGATVEGAAGQTLMSLGFDYKNDEWCGAGAPRFNVQTDLGSFFLGCTYGVHTPAPDDPSGWTRVRFSDGDLFPPAVNIFGHAKIVSIQIIFDEGTDLSGHGTPGSAHLDNIFVNGVTIGKPGTAQ